MGEGRSRALPARQGSGTIHGWHMPGRARTSHLLVCLVTAALAGWWLHQSTEFATIHGFLRSLTLAGLFAVALIAATTVIGAVLNMVTVLQKLILGTAVVGGLTMAPPAVDLSAEQPEPVVDPEAALLRRSFDIGAYAGGSINGKSDLALKQPGGTDLLMKKVLWRSESTQTEPYWGVRFTQWSRKRPMIGGMFDYTHAKAILWHRQKVEQSGTRDGKPVPSPEWVTETFRRLDFTHGLNFATLNGVFRFRGLHPRITPYVGIGVGPTFPHVYAWREGKPRETRTYKHMITGPTFQVLAGIDWRVFVADQVSWFTEYKLNHSRHDAPLKGGGSLKTNLWTHQIIPLGFTYRPPLPWQRR